MRRLALVAVVALTAVLALAGCGSDPKPPKLSMPDLVGQTVGGAEVAAYDALHTSLIYYDVSPADRTGDNTWVVVATSPSAGEQTPKFQTVFAWAMKASEYAWFKAHQKMPKVPAGTSASKLLGKGGLLEAVKDLVEVRYLPGKAPASAKPSAVDAKAFAPDRGLRPDISTEPQTEWRMRQGLLVAPVPGMVSADQLPAAGTTLRPGQFLVLLVVDKPPKKVVTPRPGVTASSTPTKKRGNGGGKTSGFNGIKLPPGVKIPNCPKTICR